MTEPQPGPTLNGATGRCAGLTPLRAQWGWGVLATVQAPPGVLWLFLATSEAESVPSNFGRPQTWALREQAW